MSAEQEVPEYIRTSPDGKTITIFPYGVPTEELQRKIACAIFIPQGRTRIIAQYPDYQDEITPQQLRDAALHWNNEEVILFIEGKADDFSWADRVTIERLEK